MNAYVCAKSLQFSLVAQLCPTLCDPMNSSMPGLPVHHQLPEFTQTHVHRVSDAIQPAHPLSSSSSQHQGLCQRVNSLHEVAKVLEFQLQHQSFQISLQSKGLSRVFSNTKSINSSALSFLHSPTLTSIHDHWENQTFVGKVMSLLLNMLSRLAITFLPRSKRLLISWLQSPSAVILD